MVIKTQEQLYAALFSLFYSFVIQLRFTSFLKPLTYFDKKRLAFAYNVCTTEGQHYV